MRYPGIALAEILFGWKLKFLEAAGSFESGFLKLQIFPHLSWPCVHARTRRMKCVTEGHLQKHRAPSGPLERPGGFAVSLRAASVV